MNVICLMINFLITTAVTTDSHADKVEVFSWHPNENPVTLYDDAKLTNKRIDIYPDINENMAGCTLFIDLEVDDVLRVFLNPLRV